MADYDPKFLARAIELAVEGMAAGAGGPFGAVLVKHGLIAGEGYNQVVSTNDPTAHAEVTVIRNTCKKLGTFQLDGYQLYSSCEPCPMCLGAVYWARPEVVYFAGTKEDAAYGGFDDSFIYTELAGSIDARSIPFVHKELAGAREVFTDWLAKPDRTAY
jgi:tRNA(Arg) A34 adenosine deaminase TadA